MKRKVREVKRGADAMVENFAENRNLFLKEVKQLRKEGEGID